jgi:hypothetical protein
VDTEPTYNFGGLERGYNKTSNFSGLNWFMDSRSLNKNQGICR